MDQYIECPVCEERFHVQVDDPKKRITCVGCSRKFPLSAAGKLTAPAPVVTKTTSDTNRLAVPPKPGASANKKVPPSNPEAELGLEPLAQPKSDNVQLKPSSPLTSQGLLKRRRNKRKVIGALVTVGLLATIIGVLSALLIMQLQKNPIAKGNSDENPVEPLRNTEAVQEINNSGTTDLNTDPNSTGETSQNDIAKDRGVTAPVKRIRLEDLPEQKFFFHDVEDVKKCWSLVNPHLLNLTVHDAYGSHQAVGTIIDSRGWILTSYSAIKGASKIEASQSVKKIDELPNPDLLKDTVRGVIKTDPAQDIAILSVNRRFITSFADIKITDENRVIEGEYMIQTAPPSADNPYGRGESKMKFCSPADKLSGASQQETSKRTQIAPATYWLGCADNQNTLPGSPLTRIDGSIQAINVFVHDDIAYYVPIHELKTMMAKATDEVQPMSTLGGGDLSNGPVTLATDHPAREASARMNALAKECEAFEWLPSEKEQFETLQAFTEQLEKVIHYIETNKESDPDRTALANTQIQQAKNLIAKSLSTMTVEKRGAIRSMNKLAAEALRTPNQVVPFYAEVIDLEVSFGKDLLGLATTDSFVTLTKDQKRERFLRDEKCFAFVKTTSNTKPVIYSVQNKKTSAITVNMITRVDDKNSF